LWLKNDINNHYVLITTPILKYKNCYYTIANDNNINIVPLDDIIQNDDEKIIQYLMIKNCYTLCDNYNIIISLYHKLYVNKIQFYELTMLLNKLKNFYYTSSIWFQIINNHRLLNSYDFPIFYLLRKPHMMDKNIIKLYDWSIYPINCAYLQTYYKKEVLITRFLSCTFPYLTVDFLNLFLGDDVINKLWLTIYSIPDNIYDSNDIITNDNYGLFASFVRNKNMWKLWQKNKKILLNKLLIYYNNNILYILSDILTSLFYLYDNGYERIKISKRRVHMIWNDIIQICVKSERDVQRFIEYSIALNIKVPYPFILDIYYNYHINWMQTRRILYNSAYSNTSLYAIIYKRYHQENINDSFYCFYKNVIQKRIIYVLMCIYKLFNMQIQTNDYIKGCIIINYLRTHCEYII
jgi:hypothetical protein